MARKPETEPIFLERAIYRRRRLIDAICLLPFLGLVLFVMPVLLSSRVDPGQIGTADRLIYFFCVWLALICFCFVLSRLIDRPSPGTRQAGREENG